MEDHLTALLWEFAEARAAADGNPELGVPDFRFAMRRIIGERGRRPTFVQIAPDLGFTAAGAFASAGVSVFLCDGSVGFGWVLIAAGAVVAGLSALLRYHRPL